MDIHDLNGVLHQNTVEHRQNPIVLSVFVIPFYYQFVFNLLTVCGFQFCRWPVPPSTGLEQTCFMQKKLRLI